MRESGWGMICILLNECEGGGGVAYDLCCVVRGGFLFEMGEARNGGSTLWFSGNEENMVAPR